MRNANKVAEKILKQRINSFSPMLIFGFRTALRTEPHTKNR
ncbi:hypothetical protein CHCC20441_0482 [Bacillus licheniformis]|uniref:Uncharacterized protein n=1 Tax=Bacillus licheniformis TaxID=1402 RepID=A0A8B5YE30_BACLI|nr:hypothetical protein B4092_0581 [Bacillus licheniformis]KYC79454.1 hypothetical protein B4091_0420 [Bacillus licheniformis]KYC96745.1 hypothetical protein B4164_0487 [Bacillus licheniformis]OLF99341.1 hypothetical protein B4089_0081 [Bacillus licheniformis]TWJ41378.1 hypothetical protein CHCC5025_3713 [Bacillus licheniformis]